jgi:Na+-driven multidrug efflux pump
LPASVEDVAFLLGNFAMFVIFSPLSNPTACQASWAVGLRVDETVFVMPIFALKLAAATIVGQNLGALQAERASKSAWRLAFCGAGFGIFMAILWFIGAKFMSSSMSSAPAVIQATVSYFLILGPSEPFFACWFILFGAMQGAGYTRLPMIISLTSLIAIRLPLAWILSINMHMGIQGCWWSIAITQVVLAFAALWLFRHGEWQKQQI